MKKKSGSDFVISLSLRAPGKSWLETQSQRNKNIKIGMRYLKWTEMLLRSNNFVFWQKSMDWKACLSVRPPLSGYASVCLYLPPSLPSPPVPSTLPPTLMRPAGVWGLTLKVRVTLRAVMRRRTGSHARTHAHAGGPRQWREWGGREMDGEMDRECNFKWKSI